MSIENTPPSEYFSGIVFNPSFYEKSKDQMYLSSVGVATSTASTTSFSGDVNTNALQITQSNVQLQVPLYQTIANSVGGYNNLQFSTDSTSLFDHSVCHDNIYLGSMGMQNLTVGNSNVNVGSSNLLALQSGYSNVCVGSNCLTSSTNNYSNTAIGVNAGTTCNGNCNTYLGSNTGQVSTNTTAYTYVTSIGYSNVIAQGQCVCIGSFSSNTGKGGVCIGHGASSVGTYALAIGSGVTNGTIPVTTGGPIATGTNAIAIGHACTATGTNSIAIGSGAIAAADNTMVLGSSSLLSLTTSATLSLTKPIICNYNVLPTLDSNQIGYRITGAITLGITTPVNGTRYIISTINLPVGVWTLQGSVTNAQTTSTSNLIMYYVGFSTMWNDINMGSVNTIGVQTYMFPYGMTANNSLICSHSATMVNTSIQNIYFLIQFFGTVTNQSLCNPPLFAYFHATRIA